MAEPTFCPEGGWVVSTHPVPDDPADHWVAEVRDIIGCNRLNCLSCGQKVRSAPNLRPGLESLRDKLAEMASTGDWTTLGYLEKSHGCRLYACTCFYRHEVSRHLVAEHDPDRRPDITFPWACGGHTPPALPLTVDGWSITADTDIAGLARRALTEGAPSKASLGFREYPAGWLGRIYYRLRSLPAAATLAGAVGDLLFADEPELVGGALAFFRLWPNAPGGERVLELAGLVGAAKTFPAKFGITKTPPSKWDRFKRTEIPESPGANLVDQFWDRESIPSKVLGHLETLALARGSGGMNASQLDGLFALLAKHDGEFLAREAASVALDDDVRAGQLLRALGDTGRGELVVVAGTALIQARAQLDALGTFLDSTLSYKEPWTPVLLTALKSAAS